jgi:hypothetical protein
MGIMKYLGSDSSASYNEYIALIFWLIPDTLAMNAFRYSYTFWMKAGCYHPRMGNCGHTACWLSLNRSEKIFQEGIQTIVLSSDEPSQV